MARAERIERAADLAAEIRLAVADVRDERAALRLQRAERLARRELGASVPKRRAATLLRISVTALDRWIAAGRIPAVRRPGGREEVEAEALVELLAEVRRLREDEGATRGVVAAALGRLAERGLPAARLRPNVPPAELRSSYLASTPVERLRQTAELSYAATALARAGARRRVREATAAR
jgi:hypothetical protein